MNDIVFTLSVSLYVCCSVATMTYGFKAYYMVWAFARRYKSERLRSRTNELRFRRSIESQEESLPAVTTQIPIYNEFNVAERVIRSVAAIDYPKSLHQIQILDDSTDETVELVDSISAELQNEGYQIEVLRRSSQEGFKAGALKEGMRSATGEFIAIFDADFVPPADFLKRCLAEFRHHPDRALIQARWGHLNRNERLLTKAIAIGIDGHFVIEQPARSWNGLFLNFNGTGGLWRRAAIEDAGGWKATTLTEDLELSYRAQLKGWKIHFLHDLVVPAEIPATYEAFKSQQFRWAKGSIQTAMIILPKLLRARLSLTVKLHAILHLTQYSIHACMLIVALLSVPLLATISHHAHAHSLLWILGLLPLIAASIGPSQLYLVSQVVQGRSAWKQLKMLPVLMITGFGICISNTIAVIDALRGVKSPFVRTPKKGIHKTKNYRVKKTSVPWLETAMGVYTLGSLAFALRSDHLYLAPYLLLYCLGFFTIGISSLMERRDITVR